MKNVSRPLSFQTAKMAKSQNDIQAGDSKALPLHPTPLGATIGSDQTADINADAAQGVSKISAIESQALAMQAMKAASVALTTCKQTLWFSFFFDGTGNNLKFDEGLKEHSNIAKLFRAHKPCGVSRGYYPFYMPGLVNLFPEDGDDGGGSRELGFGAKGSARLTHALARFDESIKHHLDLAKSPSHAIE